MRHVDRRTVSDNGIPKGYCVWRVGAHHDSGSPAAGIWFASARALLRSTQRGKDILVRTKRKALCFDTYWVALSRLPTLAIQSISTDLQRIVFL